jgi:hypothetical protein
MNPYMIKGNVINTHKIKMRSVTSSELTSAFHYSQLIYIYIYCEPVGLGFFLHFFTKKAMKKKYIYMIITSRGGKSARLPSSSS